MKTFIVTFSRTVVLNGKDNKKEFRRVTGVKAKNESVAHNKAFRKICFFTKYDHWKLFKVEEVENV